MVLSQAWATVIAALVSSVITAAVTIIISVANSNKQHDKFMQELAAQNKMFLYRLEQLEAKVSAHNHFDSRLVALEERVKTLFSRFDN